MFIELYNPNNHQPAYLPSPHIIQPIEHPHQASNAYYLTLTADGYYHLCDNQQRHSPLTIDFTAPYYRYRGGTEWLPKALKNLPHPHLADTTAGWARDSWLLAYRGFHLTLFERNPYLQLLLRQGIKRAQSTPSIAAIAKRLSLEAQDAINHLQTQTTSAYSAIYLDPMYPNKRKNAKVKKDMQALHQLLGGEEQDAQTLLQLSRAKAQQRTIVKRPQGAPLLSPDAPTYQIHAPNTRFDVYSTLTSK